MNLKAIIIIVLFAACQTPAQEMAADKVQYNAVKGIYTDTFYVITVDSCEYVVYQGAQKGGIIHKANCKNHTK